MKKAALAGISIVALGCVSWMLLGKRPASHLAESKIEYNGRPESQENQVTNMASESAKNLVVVPSVPASAAPDLQMPEKTFAMDREVLAKLENYHQLDQKVFLNDQEELEKKSLLRNREFISMAAKLLRNTENMQDPQFEEKQNTAIDVLLAALKQGDKSAAQAEITELIRDPQVENASLSQKTRQTLAGIKGELLYHASALNPQEFSNIHEALPGPVSQKIWQNVQIKQQDNFAESTAEMQAHNSKWKRQ